MFLKEDASKSEKENFMRELEIMKSVGRHVNVLSLLGCCTSKTGEQLAIIEYAKHGNLRNYLRSRRPRNYMLTSNSLLTNNFQKLYSSVNRLKTLTSDTNGLSSSVDFFENLAETNELLVIELIDYCVQIAAGMKYLHEKKVCHRDLAARNILLDDMKVPKIADFGLARDLQQNYYYRYDFIWSFSR